MYGGIVAPPLIIGTAAGLSAAQVGMLIAALFVGGLATLIQTIGTKYLGAKLPLVQGVSFAGVATMVAIITTGGGLPAVYGAVIAASLMDYALHLTFQKLFVFPTCCDRMRHHDYWAIAITRCDSLDDGW